jgi:hypothetical protein
MTTIILTTSISNTTSMCFDVARDIDVHQLSTIKSKERYRRKNDWPM